MGSHRNLCVTDASLWIDLHLGGLLQEALSLPIRWLAPDLVIAELWEPSGALLVAGGLQSCELPAPQMARVLSLRAIYRGASVADLAALLLAETESAVLVTGDRYLRRLAEQMAIRVHGTLWLLDEMVRRAAVDPADAAAGLELMLSSGSRLPPSECEQRLARWRGKP